MGSFTLKGVPDIILIEPIGDFAVFVGLEVKTKTGKLSSDQILFKKRIERINGFYFLVTNVEEVEKAIKQIHAKTM
jgi:hypothetical protein